MPSANWNLPTLTSTYSNFVSELNSKLDDLALGLDTTPTNLPTGAIQWKGASNKWQKWSGTAWADLSSTYAINVSTANSWSTPRTIALTGDVTYSTTINGSANVTSAATLATVNAAVGTYGSTTVVPVITVNAKGLITNVSSANLASMATQAASSVAITGGTLSGITSLNIPSGSGSTAEGLVQWDTVTDRLTIGTGAATKTFVDLDSVQSLSGKSFVTQVAGNSSLLPATTEFVTTANNLKANVASPSFTGTPVAPTPPTLDNTTKIATTAYVNANALMLQADIGASINLDTRTSNGVFHQPTDANATLLLNYPVALAGKLEVYVNTTTNAIYQYYHVANTTDIYVRAKLGTGAFTSWSRLAKTTDTVTASTSSSNILGGSANRIVFQSLLNTTTFMAAPTTTNTSVVWNGSSLGWGNPLATGILGGANNRIVFQSGVDTTSFVAAPTIADTALVWNGSSLGWGSSKATVADDTMYENAQTILSSYSITFGKSAMSVGPITIDSSVTVTIPSTSRWVIL